MPTTHVCATHLETLGRSAARVVSQCDHPAEDPMTATPYERPPEQTKRLARLAGGVYVALGISTLFGLFHAPLVLTDLNAITQEVTRPDFRFRIAVLADVLSTVLGVSLVLLLYMLLKPVHKTLAQLMALLLLISVPMTFVISLNYVAAQMLLSGVPDTMALTDPQRAALATLFLRLHVHGVLAEEIFWGLWLLPFGVLVMRSRFLPRLLGILLILGGVAYVAHSVTSLLLGGQRFILYERVTMLARGAGELPIMLWLLIKGVDAHRSKPCEEPGI